MSAVRAMALQAWALSRRQRVRTPRIRKEEVRRGSFRFLRREPVSTCGTAIETKPATEVYASRTSFEVFESVLQRPVGSTTVPNHHGWCLVASSGTLTSSSDRNRARGFLF